MASQLIGLLCCSFFLTLSKMYVYLSSNEKFAVKIDGCDTTASSKVTKAPANTVKTQQGNAMFAGEFRCGVDDKGRFVLPSVFRGSFPVEDEQLAKSVIMLKSLDHSLWLYRTHEWEEKLIATRQHLDDEQSRLFMHYVVAESAPSEVDKNGRLSIPKRLREFAEIDNEVVLIGLYERIELWSPLRWEAYLLRLEERHEMTLGKILSIL
jgi:MraZ protein